MQARADIVRADTVAYYHCVSRCVRRAFLCGQDPYSSRNFEHRKEWVRNRLSVLINCFAIELVAYAVMSNHLHSVIQTRPDLASQWTDREVAERWVSLFPGNTRLPEKRERKVQMIASNPSRVALYRGRLSSVSWFNRCLNENIARKANAEDDVTGRFWEGRFRCQLIKDIRGVLACSVYVDLNPIRAGAASTPETSDYTSIQDRIQSLTKPTVPHQGPRLLDVTAVFGKTIDLAQYIALVDATGRTVKEGSAAIPDNLTPILERLGIKPNQWLTTSRNYRTLFRRIVGTVEQIREHAEMVHRSWFHGLTSAASVFTTGCR